MKKRIRLTEGQLYGLIRQALNEADWKTYANAESKLSDACDEIRKGVLKGYSAEPVVLNILSKHIGREKAKDIVNSLDSDELSAYLSENDIDVKYEANKMREKFRTAKALSFAYKHGHMPSTKPIVIPDPNVKTYMGLMRNQDDIGDTHITIFNDETLDQYGNTWELPAPDYNGGIVTKNGWSSIHQPELYYPTHKEPCWDHFVDNEKDEEYLNNLTQSEAGKDLYNYAADNYEYVKGKGWQLKQKNESLARRVTESIIRKLNENDVADIYHDDALSNIALTIENDSEIYEQMTWLKNALAKKVKRGLVPDRNYLANCSTVRKIAQKAVRKNIKFYEEQWGERPPYLSNAQKQEIRYHIADLILDRLSDDGLI